MLDPFISHSACARYSKKGLLDVRFTVQYLVIVSTSIKMLETAMYFYIYGKHLFFADSKIRGVTILLLSLKGTVSHFS
jgi:hypothetical protein